MYLNWNGGVIIEALEMLPLGRPWPVRESVLSPRLWVIRGWERPRRGGRKRGDTFQETEGVKRNFRRSPICSAYARGHWHSLGSGRPVSLSAICLIWRNSQRNTSFVYLMGRFHAVALGSTRLLTRLMTRRVMTSCQTWLITLRVMTAYACCLTDTKNFINTKIIHLQWQHERTKWQLDSSVTIDHDSILKISPFKSWVMCPDSQGWEVSTYSLDQAWIEAIFRLGISLERHNFGCRGKKRYIFLY